MLVLEDGIAFLAGLLEVVAAAEERSSLEVDVAATGGESGLLLCSSGLPVSALSVEVRLLGKRLAVASVMLSEVETDVFAAAAFEVLVGPSTGLRRDIIRP